MVPIAIVYLKIGNGVLRGVKFVRSNPGGHSSRSGGSGFELSDAAGSCPHGALEPNSYPRVFYIILGCVTLCAMLWLFLQCSIFPTPRFCLKCLFRLGSPYTLCSMPVLVFWIPHSTIKWLQFCVWINAMLYALGPLRSFGSCHLLDGWDQSLWIISL